MIKSVLILLCLLLMFSNLSAKEYLYEDLQSELKNLKADESKIAIIKDLFWEKENGSFSLDSGKMYFMQPINNRISCAIFIGKGSFSFTPPTKVEKIQLERLMKTQFFTTEVEAMVMFFTDSTYEFIKNNFAMINGTIPDKVGDLYERAHKYVVNINDKEVDFYLTRALLPSHNTGFSLNMIWKNIGKLMDYPYIWSVDPLEEEEIKFMKGDWHAGAIGYYITPIIQLTNTFNFNEKEKSKYFKNEFIIEKYTVIMTDTSEEVQQENIDFDNLDISKYLKKSKTKPNTYNLDLTNLGSNSDSTNIKYFITTIRYKSLRNTIGCLDFELNNQIIIDSILDENFKKNYFHINNEYSQLLLKLNSPVSDSEYHDITFYYRTYGIQDYSWLPFHSNNENAFYELTYKLRKNKIIESIFDNSEIKVFDDFQIFNLDILKKINYPWVLYGEYNKKIVNTDSLRPILKYYYKDVSNANEIISYFESLFNFFSQVFGKSNENKIFIEIINSHNINIITDKGLKISINLEDNLNSSKELSSLWWGINLKSYSKNDDWLIEALKIYSGLLLMQMGMQDKETIFSQLKKSKNEFFRLNGDIDSDNSYPVIISLGKSNNFSAQWGDFDNLIYYKGAWVLHMLRNLFIDFNTMDDSAFLSLLKEFFQTYKDSYATTQDFINIVNKYAGTDMTWFFNQWVESNEMPTYTFGYKTEQTPEGKYKVTARIKQTGVNEKFMMSVPVKVDYGESYVVLRLNVTSPFLEFEFPLFDKEPKKFQLNAYESVLCEVEYDDFDDIEK